MENKIHGRWLFDSFECVNSHSRLCLRKLISPPSQNPRVPYFSEANNNRQTCNNLLIIKSEHSLAGVYNLTVCENDFLIHLRLLAKRPRAQKGCFASYHVRVYVPICVLWASSKFTSLLQSAPVSFPHSLVPPQTSAGE